MRMGCFTITYEKSPNTFHRSDNTFVIKFRMISHRKPLARKNDLELSLSTRASQSMKNNFLEALENVSQKWWSLWRDARSCSFHAILCNSNNTPTLSMSPEAKCTLVTGCYCSKSFRLKDEWWTELFLFPRVRWLKIINLRNPARNWNNFRAVPLARGSGIKIIILRHFAEIIYKYKWFQNSSSPRKQLVSCVASSRAAWRTWRGRRSTRRCTQRRRRYRGRRISEVLRSRRLFVID